MWLSEAAVDLETLDILAEQGIKFTILAPHQAHRERETGKGEWRDVNGQKVDPTRGYLCRLPSGRSISIFFYDGPISRAVAFERLLAKGEDFANRFLSGFSDIRQWPQIVNIATDGESYGHHHKFGDMALASALNYIESNGLARLTNYGEHLERHPPAHEVEIIEDSSWSCIHGIERWRSNCGCNSGGHPEWKQEWRAPLREALDWLRDQLSSRYQKAGEYLKDPWKARDEYIEVILDRSEGAMQGFFERHAARGLSMDERVTVLKLLEVQRHAMLMYTSCGWFFDELSGIETVQVIQYAGRAIQLSEGPIDEGLEKGFLERLEGANSNLPEHGNGAIIYERCVKPAMIDLKKVAVHYAVSSLFEDYGDETDLFSYSVKREDYQRLEAGRTKIAMGRISATSKVTLESELLTFCVLHLGNHDLNGGVRTYLGPEAYQSMKDEIGAAFDMGGFADVVRLMDKHFGMHTYSLRDLFRDEQRNILNLLIGETREEFAALYRRIYEENRMLMSFLRELEMPVPKAFRSAAEFTLNFEMQRELSNEDMDLERLENPLKDIRKFHLPLDYDVEFAARHRLERMLEQFQADPSNQTLLLQILRVLDLMKWLSTRINYWQIQNTFYRMARTEYADFLKKSKAGSDDAAKWVESFRHVGELLFFNIPAVLPGGEEV